MASLSKMLRRNPATGEVETYYRIARRVDGKRRDVSLGFLSEADAALAFKRWTAMQLLGLDTAPLTPPPSSSGAPTIRDWWGDIVEPWPTWPACRMLDYIDAKGYRPKTRRLADCARRVIVAHLGRKGLDEITAAEGDAFLAAMVRAELSSRTRQIYLDWLRRSLEVAVTDKRIAVLPVLTRPRDTDRKRSRWLTPEDSARLLTALDERVAAGIIEPDAALAIRMQETLVLRPGEVLSRRWEDLAQSPEWRVATLAIRSAQLPDGTTWHPKNADATRSVAVPARLLALIREQWMRQGQPGTGWIFPQPERPAWPRTQYKRALAGACRAAGVTVLNPHALRHTGATRLAMRGVERRTLMEIGGWTTGEMLDEVYEHTSDARKAEALRDAELTDPEVPGGS